MESNGCVGCKHEFESADSVGCLGCEKNAIDKYVKRTNADRIRNMSDEELAMFIMELVTGHSRGEIQEYCNLFENGNYCDYNLECDKCILKWLKSEVRNDI